MPSTKEFIIAAFRDLKEAIDEINAENNGLVLAYPSHVDIDHEGVRVSIPFNATKGS